LMLATAERRGAEVVIATSIKPEVRFAAEDALKSANNKIREAKNNIDRLKLSGEATNQAIMRLGTANKNIEDGKLSLEKESYGEAFSLFQKASRRAEEAKLFATAQEDKRINVRGTLEIATGENADDDLSVFGIGRFGDSTSTGATLMNAIDLDDGSKTSSSSIIENSEVENDFRE